MADKHTPGPWKVQEAFNRIETEEEIIATVDGWGLGNGKANARLIAAAPELLKALEHMVAVSNWATTIQSEEQYDVMIAEAESAIRKAKGE